MMSLTFGLFTQVSGSGPLGPLVSFLFLIKPYQGCHSQGKISRKMYFFQVRESQGILWMSSEM